MEAKDLARGKMESQIELEEQAKPVEDEAGWCCWFVAFRVVVVVLLGALLPSPPFTSFSTGIFPFYFPGTAPHRTGGQRGPGGGCVLSL